jgi:glutaredoxin-like YruB-family protein
MKTVSFFLALLLALPAFADLYQWVDDKGTIRIGSHPPEGAKKIRKYTSSPRNSSPPAPAVVPGKAADLKLLQGTPAAPKVELFVTSWCPYCVKAKNYLASKGISYTEYNVENDPAAAARMRQLGGSGGVPFALIGTQPVVGYSPEAYDQALNSSR